MLTNLDVRNWTLRREPILWIFLLIAVLTVVADVVQGDQNLSTALTVLVELAVGFLARGKVTPVVRPVDGDGHELVVSGQ